MQSQRAPPPSASASLAATKAFMKNAESNGNLSSAAAAAALRTHVTTPTPVGDTVTKRMARRGSHSSNGSSSKQPAAALQRQSSSGSMTERSFRAPSPGRASPADPHAPPVPPVPTSIQHEQQQTTTIHRRASSVGPTYRGVSPGPRGGGRGVSLDRGASNASNARKGTQRPPNSLAHVSEEEASPSINFSRPMSPGATAVKKTPSPPTTSSGWFGGPVVNQDAIQRMASTSRPKTSSGVTSHHLHNVQRSVQNAADRPVTTHHIAQRVQGARLASASMRPKPFGTAVQSQILAPRQAPRPVDPNSPDAVYDPSTRTFIHKQDAMARHREMHEQPEHTPQHEPQYTNTFHPVYIPENQMDRGPPSPIRHHVQQQPLSPPLEEPRAAVERHSDDFVHAHVQVPEQANAGRKLEDSGYGTIVGHEDDRNSPVFAQPQDSAYPRLSTPASSRPASTHVVPDHERVSHERSSSLNPPRTAHFAPVAVELTGLKHDPLPRSVSPAKSALKASPSVSRRGESPISSSGRLHSLGAQSEASDTASDEGGRRKKRNVRVSFEEDLVASSHSAPAHSEPTYAGLGVSKWGPIAEKDDEFEDLRKPRPALPMFGSIREKERRPRDEVPEKVTETVPTDFIGQSHVSSDLALGNIFARDHARKQEEHGDPLPPQVTTVEGSGYVSDSSDYSDHHEPTERKEISQGVPAPEPKSLSAPHQDAPSGITEQVVTVPNIAFQPPTPSPYEKPEPKFQSIGIPEECDQVQASKPDASLSAPSARTQPTSQTSQSTSHGVEESTDDESSVYSDAYEDLSDAGGFASIDALMDKPVDPPPGLMPKYAVPDTTDSPTPTLRQETFSNETNDTDITPTIKQGPFANESSRVETPTQDWNAAQLHWSGINGSLRQSQEPEVHAEQPSKAQPVTNGAVKAPVSQDHTARAASSSPSSKPLKSALKKTSTPQTTRPAESQNNTMQTMAPRDSQPEIRMRRTMRGGANTDAQTDHRMGSTMRSSMRGPPENSTRAQPQMRQSMRSAGTAPASNMGLAASRHSMGPMDTKPPRGALQKKNIPASVAPSKPRPQSMPVAKPMAAAPVPTYDSDSDASVSSFQRSRNRGPRQKGGRYTMRASMRQGPAPTMRASAPAPKQVQAISPPVSPSPAMRKSMRPSSPTPEPVKSSKFSIRSLSPMGRFRKGPDPVSLPVQEKPMPSFAKQPKLAKPAVQPAKLPKATKAPFKSRFADSSDEDEDDIPSRFQSRFQSRFEDSDDEPTDYELPPGLRPVRGIPREPGEEDGDSTDLEEEVDEVLPEEVSKPAPQTNGVNGGANKQGASLAAGSLRDGKQAPLPSFQSGGKSKSRRSLFGFGKKKTAQAESVQAQPEPVQHTSAPNEIPMPPAQRNRDKGIPMTPIDEDKEFFEPTPTTPKKSPKLQRRSTPDWPLPPAIGTDNRPVSSDGVAARRPRFASRQPSAVSNVSAPIVDTQGHSVSYGRSGKKKKFQGLRRVFGLND